MASGENARCSGICTGARRRRRRCTSITVKAALAPVTGSVKADNLTLDLTGSFKNIGPLMVSNALTINAPKGIDNSNASIHTGTLNITSHDGFLNNTNGQINAQSLQADIAGQLDNIRGTIRVAGNAYLKTGDVLATQGLFQSTGGNFALDSTGNITLKASTLSADQGLLKLKAAGNIDLGYIQGPRTTSTTTERLDDPTVIRSGGCTGTGDNSDCTNDHILSAGSTLKSLQSISDAFLGTELSAANIQLRAGKDLTLTASELQSTGDIALSALGQVSVGAAVGTTDTTHTQTRSDTQLVDVYDGGDSGSWSQHLQTTTSTQTTTGTQQFAQGSNHTAQGKLRIQSGADMAIDSSALKGEQGVALLSAGDLNIGGQHLEGQSTERKPATAGQQETTTAQETLTFAGSAISSGSGSVSAVALGDVSASGSTLAAKQNINLIGDSVSVKAQVNTTTSKDVQGNPYGGRHWQITDKQTQTLAGGQVEAGQDINVIAGMSAELGYQVGLLTSPTSALPQRANNAPNANSSNITLSGAQLSAGTPGSQEVGQVNLLAQGDIDIGTVEVVNKSDTFKFDKYRNTGGNTTITQRTVTETHTQVGASVSADQINVAAGGDLSMTGSAVSAASDARLAATGNVTIQAATNTETRYTEDSNSSSGITSSGSLSLHVGSSSQKSQAWLDATSQSQGMSLVGSEFGSVSVTAGKDSNISGTILGTTSAGEIAAAKVANGTATEQEAQEAKAWLERLQDANAKDPQLATNARNINLSGQSVSVTSGLDTLDQRTKFEAQQSGVTVALSSAVVSAVQGAVSTGQTLSHAASNTSSSRMQGLAGAAGALAAYNTYNQAKDLLKDPSKATDISVNVSLGSSKSSASSQDKSTTAVGSQVVSAGSVNVTARNPDGKTNTNDQTANAGRIVIEGSQVIATENITLNADRDITLLAAGNTSVHSSQNKSSSGSVGASFSGAGISATASASRAIGQADGTSQSSTNTRVQAGGTLTFNSSGDTTMQGATASGNKVTAAVGGNLNLSSLQDTSQYQDKSQSSGFSVSVPITGGAASASVSHSKTSINSNYQSVGEQTAIRAGDGGFDIDVQGKTTLTGAQITSTDKAVQGGKNKFNSAGGLDMQDLQNSAQFDASSYSVSATVQGDSRNKNGQEKDGTPRLDAAGKPTQANPQGKPEGSFGFGSDSGQGSSTSTSGISGVAGDTTARTGDEETGLKPLFDAAKTKADVQGQVAITAEFGKNASKAWGDFATNKEQELRSQGQHEEADKWREGGTYRAAGHFVIGGLGGGGAGALASGGISLGADKLNSLQDELKDKLIALGMSPDAAQMFSQGAGMATAGTLGTAAGGTVGGGSAFNTDTNNRQLHPDERKKARELTAKAKAMGLTKPDGSAYMQEDIEDEMRRGSNKAKGETAASNMIINPEADKAVGSNPKDAMASTNFDKGAVFNNTGGYVVQVERDGSPLASKSGDPDLQAYIQANTGGADSPYVWVNTQPDKANPNAGLKTMTPAQNGCATAECAGGVVGVRNPVRDGSDVRSDVADGAALVSRGSGIVSSTATAVSTIPGPHQPGAATTAVVATGVGFVADVVEQVARPDVGKGVHDFFLNTAQNQIDNKLPLAAPFSNEVKTFWTNSGTAKSFEVWVNERWSEAVKQLEKNK